MKGTVKMISDEIVIGDKFKKKELILETLDKYPQVFKIEFVNDKISLLDDIMPFSNVEVDIQLRGREWQGKCFTSIHGVGIKNYL
jgi:hypothetical protein